MCYLHCPLLPLCQNTNKQKIIKQRNQHQCHHNKINQSELTLDHRGRPPICLYICLSLPCLQLPLYLFIPSLPSITFISVYPFPASNYHYICLSLPCLQLPLYLFIPSLPPITFISVYSFPASNYPYICSCFLSLHSIRLFEKQISCVMSPLTGLSKRTVKCSTSFVD